MANHKKYRCADYAVFDNLKEARQHALELSKSVDQDNRHITGLIYACVDCRAFYCVYLPYEAKRREPVRRTAEIIEFPKSRTTRTNPGLIEGGEDIIAYDIESYLKINQIESEIRRAA